MAAMRAPLYRDFLTPSLHRRFTGAAVVILIVSYVEAVLIGDKSSLFWSWFPLGLAGIRTLLLFISALSIFVLRVAQIHIGIRTTASPFKTVTKYFFRLDTVHTLAWYLFSAWWFSEVYMWSVPSTAELNWVIEGQAWERRKLNERPIYLRSVFFMLAVLQSAIHLYYDYDKVTLPTTLTEEESAPKQHAKNQLPFTRLRDEVPQLLQTILLRAVCMGVFGPIVYALFVRSAAWKCSLYVASVLWDVPQSRLSYIPPYHISLIIRSCTSGFLLLTLWEASNKLFGAYAAQEPLKNGQPLTSESKDPNGSLLRGAQSRREVPKAFAFWELSTISRSFETRRKAIFTDIDRPNGSAWNQIMTLCLGNILAISNRIAESQNPSSQSTPHPQQVTIERLPQISQTQLRHDNVFLNPPAPTNRREQFESKAGAIAKYYNEPSQSPKPVDFLKKKSLRAGEYVESARQHLLTQEQQQTYSKSGLLTQYNDYLIRFLRSPVGYPFRETFKRRVTTIVLGAPYGELDQILSSITTLTALAKASINEDRYGNVAKDVPLLLRAFVSTISSVEGFVARFPVHWTDVEFQESDRRVEEIALIVDSLRGALKDIVSSFGQYAAELGLGKEEIETARKIAGLDDGE